MKQNLRSSKVMGNAIYIVMVHIWGGASALLISFKCQEKLL